MYDVKEGLKESLQYLVGIGEEKVKTFEINGKTYATECLTEIKETVYRANALKTSTLTSVVDYLNNNADKLDDKKLIVHIESPFTVNVYSELDIEKRRECYIEATALTSRGLKIGDYIPTEDFNIMMQACFQESDHQRLLLKVTGCIKDNTIKDFGDDGVSQTATIKTGVATVNDVVVPNPVTLIPYRTFPEIRQPDSKFVFRMKSGEKTPYAALIEADGGAWRNEAMSEISDFLEESINIEIKKNILIIA